MKDFDSKERNIEVFQLVLEKIGAEGKYREISLLLHLQDFITMPMN